MRKTTRINLEFHKKFSKYSKVKEKMIRAADYIEEVVNSEEFKTFIYNHEFQGMKHFADCPMTNTEVYQRLMSGVETLQPEVDYEWDIKVIPYWSKKRVIGYTYPSRKEIWANMRYYKISSWSEADCAANMAHEWTHKSGFKHSFRRSWKWPFTVPYAVGSYVKKQVNVVMGKMNLEEVESGGLNHMSWIRRAWYKVINFIF